MELERLIGMLKDRTPVILGSDQFIKYSILLPLIHHDGELRVLFEVRAHTLRRQPGEICFPGGKIDQEDRDEQYSAIRETSEELGISESTIANVFPLDYMVSAFGTIIYPYVGVIEDYQAIKPNPAEVAEIFTVPLSFFKRTNPEKYKINFQIQPEENFPFDSIQGGEKYNWQTRQLEEYFYRYEGKVIWGLTARVLSHFLEIISEK
ncbi:NUDIX hydrolase [Bacillus canaveralius]|uniref:NUDIX hydrolase n=1 Tax=Bacillus canaveralius TaxID=1403243 RepID=UPI000F7B1790|nr:CoA pyrophosphatase [Bacillus canaveralius]RSK47461.1 CoA pyrophosphatase [Bacillus canaveralius]